jgi:hypothetical protein
MSSLVISGTSQAYISNCTVDTQVTKSSSGYVEIINSELQCTLGIQISGAGITIINGNKNVGVSVSNASAQVIIKGCNSVVTPSASAGNLAIVDCVVTALGGNGITITGSLTTLTLINSQVLVTAGNNVAPISVAGIYTIINTVYDKPSSTLTGTSTNSIDYFQYINADKFITQGGTSSQYVMGDGSLSNGFTGGTVSGSTIFTNGLSANTISATTYQNLPISGLTEGSNINISGSNGNFTISVTGLTQGLTGEYLPLSGGTVSGGTHFTNGLTANTISATTYQNLPVTADTYVTGYTYNNNTFTIKQNNGKSDLTQTLNTVTGLTSTGTISSNTISATTYQNLPVTADTFTTGFTYSSNTFTIGRNQGLSALTATIGSVTGLTSTGTISSSSLSATTLTVNGVSITGDTFVTGGTYSAGTITFRNNQNTTFPVTGLTQPFTGGTVSGPTNFTNGLTANTISATTYQNLPVTADTFTTGFTYSSNTFTIGRNQGLSGLTATINTVTGLTSTGTISSSSLSATTLTVNGVSITGDTFATGGTYSAGTITFRNNTNTTFPVTGLTTGVTITNNVNNYLLTATGTANSINGEGNATFDGTTLDLKKNSTNPNIILSDTGGTSNDVYIRFEATSAGTPTYAIGVDKSDSNKLKFTYDSGGSASPGGTARIEIAPTGLVSIPFDAVPTLTIGSVEQIELASTTTSSQILLKNGSTGTLSTSLTQFTSFSALEANVGSTVANEEFYIVNDSVSGTTNFKNNGVNMVTIYPTGRTDVNSGYGVAISGNLFVAGTMNVGTLIGTGSPLYRNTSTGIFSSTSSDARLKKDVQPINNALDIVKNLNGVYFKWNNNDDFKTEDETRQIGLIAQEVEQHLPEAVTLNGVKDYKTIRYSEMVSVLVEAMKEQQQQIDSLKTEIQDLKNRISNIGG